VRALFVPFVSNHGRAALARAVAVALALASTSACDPFSPDLGDEPFRCGEGGACPDGYSCEPVADIPSGVCVSGSDTGSGDGDGGDGDGDDDASLCADADLEPNDSIVSAVITSVPDQQLQYQEAGLAVCPPGDTDLFRFRVAIANQNIRAEVATDRGLGELVAEITNEQGVTLATGTYNPSNDQLTVELPNAAIDTYHLRISGFDAQVENSYDVDLQLTGP